MITAIQLYKHKSSHCVILSFNLFLDEKMCSWNCLWIANFLSVLLSMRYTWKLWRASYTYSTFEVVVFISRHRCKIMRHRFEIVNHRMPGGVCCILLSHCCHSTLTRWFCGTSLIPRNRACTLSISYHLWSVTSLQYPIKIQLQAMMAQWGKIFPPFTAGLYWFLLPACHR